MRILVICTKNSARSVILQAYLKKLKPDWHIFSAGTHPAQKVNPLAIKVLAQEGIDISAHKPTNVENFIHEPFDFVITVCDEAKAECPVFKGKVKNIIHAPFQDPSKVSGNEEEKLDLFHKIKTQIKEFAVSFVKKHTLVI